MRTALILNPTAGKSPLASRRAPEEKFEPALLAVLRSQGLEPDVYYTTAEDPGRSIAGQLVGQGIEMIVAVGGDGTIHSVAQALANSDCLLGIIPAGTMNNLALSLGIPENLEEACALLTTGVTRSIDVGSINGHIFLEVAGVGLEAAIFPAAEEVKSNNMFTTLKGVIRGLYALLIFRPPQMRLTFNHERPRSYRAIQLTVCNAPYYGVHLNIAPEIRINDGWLDAVLYRNFSKREYIRHAISISQGRRAFTPKIVHRQVRSLRIETNQPVEIQADGISHGHTPAEITIKPGALKVQTPREPGPGLLPSKPGSRRIRRMLRERRRSYVSTYS